MSKDHGPGPEAGVYDIGVATGLREILAGAMLNFHRRMTTAGGKAFDLHGVMVGLTISQDEAVVLLDAF